MLFSFTGLNVPSPTCSVTSAISTHLFFTSSKSSFVKCNPAVGAAAEPLSLEYTVWYLYASSNLLCI